MAGGEAGVDRAIEILSGQVSRTMRLLGVTSLEELTPQHVTQLHRFGRGASEPAASCHTCHCYSHRSQRIFGVPRVRAESESLANRDVATRC